MRQHSEKSEQIYDGITNIRDDIVEQARPPAAQKGKARWKWPAAVAAALAVVLAGTAILWPGGSPIVPSAYAIAEASYPEMVPYPDESKFFNSRGDFDDDAFFESYDAWWESVARQRRPEGYADGLEGYFAASSAQFLSGAGEDNRVYSPLNVYMALAMLAEVTDGDSRQQILDLLGSGDIESLRQQASDVWNAHYRDDGAVTSILANSLWLNQDVSFVQSTMDTLSDTYYASAYRGKMGSGDFNKALQDWLNRQTGGLLEEQASQIELDPETILALASTIYFRAKWSSEFLPNRTEEGVFHAAGGDISCDFMHQGGTNTYYWGERFSAISRYFTEEGSMWFLLPDEGVSPEDLLRDDQAMEFLFQAETRREWENQKHLIVNQSIPKFDVSSQIDLTKGLQALGITDVFDPTASDYSPMTRDTDEIYLSQATHAARVTIDEEGCTAAAFTVMANAGSGMPPDEEVDFILDRPFLFAITSDDGLPLFVGVVNHPV